MAQDIVLVIQLFLLTISSAGLLSLWLIHRRAPQRASFILCLIFLLLELNQFRFIINMLIPAGLSLIPPVQIALSAAIILVLYGLLFLLLNTLDPARRLQNAVLSGGVIILQLLRTFAYFLGYSPGPFLGYIAPMILLSAYLMWVGWVFRWKIRAPLPSGVRILLQRLGIVTLLFSPISLVVYLVWHVLGFSMPLGLDSILLVIWSLVAIELIIEYLGRLGSVPAVVQRSPERLASYRLSPREVEVLNLVLEGLNNREIGERLFISHTTARTHVSHIFEKVGVGSRMDLIARLLRE